MKLYSFIAFLALMAPTTLAMGSSRSRDNRLSYFPFTATPTPTPTPKPKDKMSSSVECSMEVCFAIEGSDMINETQFSLQKTFIAELVKTVNATSSRNDIRFAAAQYGVSNDVISFLTKDVSSFLRAVENTRFRKTEVNFVSGGIIFCHRDLFTTGVENGAIVLLGTGRSTFGGDPVKVAQIFGGKILTVGIGKSNRKKLLEIVGDNRKRRFDLNESNVLRVVSGVLRNICDLDN